MFCGLFFGKRLYCYYLLYYLLYIFIDGGTYLSQGGGTQFGQGGEQILNTKNFLIVSF